MIVKITFNFCIICIIFFLSRYIVISNELIFCDIFKFTLKIAVYIFPTLISSDCKPLRNSTDLELSMLDKSIFRVFPNYYISCISFPMRFTVIRPFIYSCLKTMLCAIIKLFYKNRQVCILAYVLHHL